MSNTSKDQRLIKGTGDEVTEYKHLAEFYQSQANLYKDRARYFETRAEEYLEQFEDERARNEYLEGQLTTVTALTKSSHQENERLCKQIDRMNRRVHKSEETPRLGRRTTGQAAEDMQYSLDRLSLQRQEENPSANQYSSLTGLPSDRGYRGAPTPAQALNDDTDQYILDNDSTRIRDSSTMFGPQQGPTLKRGALGHQGQPTSQDFGRLGQFQSPSSTVGRTDFANPRYKDDVEQSTGFSAADADKGGRNTKANPLSSNNTERPQTADETTIKANAIAAIRRVPPPRTLASQHGETYTQALADLELDVQAQYLLAKTAEEAAFAELGLPVPVPLNARANKRKTKEPLETEAERKKQKVATDL